eukprot:Rhum_TRINITY_DN23358_c0_g1::Rhum_TRINITY_DN23358_c0_g1_i1::g.177741::m.177741/K10598/PPIL2, CYC4, CHP60; peptidyl-prolyl cis-trans isomerase-like 2
MSDKPKQKLTKQQKAEKYGKKYKQGWLEYNAQALEGGVEELKRGLELEAEVKARLGRAGGVVAQKKPAWNVQDNLHTMLRTHVVRKSLSLSRHSKVAEERVRYFTAERVVKEKLSGFVTLVTSSGSLRLEVFCNLAPTAAENFLGLCERGYYDGTSFHRLVKGFMAQGGDPTKTGEGGESLWGPEFEDELHPSLSHSQRGVLAMANSGADTNKSQFYITFDACTHLDKKHTIFGELVGGAAVLDEIEAAPTNANDRPLAEITIQKAIVHFSPFSFLKDQ